MDGTDRSETTNDEPGFLPEFAAGGRLGGLALFDPTAREFPEPGKEPGGRASLHEPPAALPQDDDRGAHVRSPALLSACGDRPRVPKLEAGAAAERDRAPRAFRVGGETERLSELHHRLIELARTPGRKDRPKVLLERRANPGVSHVPFVPGPPGRDPKPVRFEGDRRRPERDRRDRARDVGTDPGEPLELGDGGRDRAAHGPDHDPRCFVEVVGTGVVSGPLPDLQHPADGGSGERFDGGKLAEEPREVRARRSDPRLLEEDLRDPDAVRVPVEAPRKRPLGTAIPAEKTRCERRGKRSTDRRARPHGTRVRDEPGT